MENPFDIIEDRLSKIESLILDLKQEVEKTDHKEQDQLLTIQEAAQFLKLKVPTIYSKVSKGELPVMKRSGRLYFSSTQLLEYIKEGRKKTFTEIEKEAQSYFDRRK